MAKKEVVIEVIAETGATEKDLKKVVKGVEQVKEEAKETSKETKKLSNDFGEMGGQLDSVTGGAITKFKGLTGMLKNTAKGFRTLRGAIISTGIGALVVAITSVTAAFTASEDGQNRFSKILKQLGVIAGNVGDIFSSLGTVILETLSGNFNAAGDAFDQLKERIFNFGDETRKELELAGDLSDKIADANKQERALLVERAKVNVEINKLKTKAAEVDKFTSEERIRFLELAAAKEDEITKKQVALAIVRRDIKIEENSLSESTKEDLDEEAQLVANVIQLEEQRLVRNKELLGVAAGLRKAEADAKANERAAEIDAFKKERLEINQLKKVDNEFEKGLVSDLSDLKKITVKENAKLKAELSAQEREDMLRNMDILRGIIGEETALGKALFIAKQAILVKEQIMEAKATLTRITMKGAEAQVDVAGGAAKTASKGFPANVPLLIAFAAQAAGIIATIKSAIDATKRATPAVGGGVSSSSSRPLPPVFNIVGAAPESQLAQTIGEREQQPLKAYVVSADVTTAQDLDRNIIEGASI